MTNVDSTVKELTAGIIIYGILAQVICLMVSDDLLFSTVGLWIGIATALGMMLHMKRSIEDALDYGESGAAKHIRKTYALRFFVVAVVFGVTIYFKVGNIITALIGVMSLKIAAYLQPCVHRVFLKLQKSK